MFLHLLQTDKEKEAFIQMAFIVAIANVEDSDGKDKKNVELDPFTRRLSGLTQATGD